MTKRKPGKRTKSGRLSRAIAAQAERTQTQTKAARDETLSTARQARERQLPKHLAGMALDQMAGCTAGRTIIATEVARDAQADLWNAVQHMRKVYAAYDRLHGLNRYAQVARILAPVSAMEADASSPAFDDRDDETKQRQAVAAWMQVQGWLGCIDSAAAQECKAVVIGLPEDATARRPAMMLAGLAAIVRGLKK